MAKPVRKSDKSANGKTAAERAREHLKSDGPKPKVVIELASDRDAQHHVGQCRRAEKAKKKAYAEADQIRSEAKADYDKVYTDAQDALKSRGITKTMLKERVDEDARKDEEVTRNHQSRLWLGRATQSKWAQNHFDFGEPISNAGDAEAKAEQRGRDDSAEGKPEVSPFAGNQLLDQAYMRGHRNHQTEAAGRFKGKGSEGGAAVN